MSKNVKLYSQTEPVAYEKTVTFYVFFQLLSRMLLFFATCAIMCCTTEIYFLFCLYERKREKSREMYREIDLDKINITAEPPVEEPARQYYYMAKCREWVWEFERKNGRRPFAFTQTFGCPNV